MSYFKVKMTKFDFGWCSAQDALREMTALPQLGPWLDLMGRTFKVKEVWPREREGKEKRKGERGEEREMKKENGREGRGLSPALALYDNVAAVDYFTHSKLTFQFIYSVNVTLWS